jgi:hypothetical protein
MRHGTCPQEGPMLGGADCISRAANLQSVRGSAFSDWQSRLLSLGPSDSWPIFELAKGEVAVRTVAFDKFGQPVGALVDDCEATPRDTLWRKLKKAPL